MRAGMMEQLTQLSKKMARQTETAILSQLNEFIKRGLIEVEVSETSLFQDMDSAEIRIARTVKLKLKDQEYIEKLETINKSLLQTISEFRKKV